MNRKDFCKSDGTIAVFGFDDRIARHSVQALNSLSRNTRHTLNAVILARRWRPWTEAYYRALELERLRIRIVDMSAASFSGDLRLLAHTTAATLSRLYLPRLLPDVDRVAYLDTDLICVDDLKPLYEFALPESGIAARPSVKEGYATLPDLVTTWAPPPGTRDDPLRVGPQRRSGKPENLQRGCPGNGFAEAAKTIVCANNSGHGRAIRSERSAGHSPLHQR